MTLSFLFCSEVRMTSSRSARRDSVTLAEAAGAPTPERRHHGPIERFDQAIADDNGRPSRPYRAVDTLAMMQRRGSITPAMRQAAETFRARFAAAHLDPLRALDWSRLRSGV